MRTDSFPLTPDNWIRDVFDCKAVVQGNVIRRKRRDIERYAGMDRFMREVGARGFQAIENRGQVIVFCNREPIRRLL